MSKKLSDQGWFYHAPPKPGQKERVVPPPPSQIPGLSDVSYLPPEPPNSRSLIRESDSKYIRLAKQGGRQDLLVMRTPEPPSSEPVGYPRCEWFYHNEPEDTNGNREPYEFMLPDYMVHMPARTESNGVSSAVGRTPYAYDGHTVYDRDGNQANDKTVKLSEDRPSGYGVRCQKQQQRQTKKAVGDDSNQQPPLSASQFAKASSDVTGPRRDEDHAQMKKLLSYSYAADYEKQKAAWSEHEEALNKANGPTSSESQQRIAAQAKPSRLSSNKARADYTKKSSAASRT